MRHVLIHYHIFKNAGTSLDECLRASFGSGWATFEGVRGTWTNVTTADMLGYLREHSTIRAVSSHSARWPEPSANDIQAHPLVLLRHPIDRVGSIYAHQKRRGTPTSLTMSEFVDERLQPEVWASIRSFQTMFLSDEAELSDAFGHQIEVTAVHFAAAIRRLNELPTMGLVERFECSLGHIATQLEPYFPQLQFKPLTLNVSPGRGATLAGRINEVQDALGPVRYRRLVRMNEADLELYRCAEALFNARTTGHAIDG